MDEEERREKFWQKLRDDPTVPIGIIGLTSIVVYGLYNFKNRGTQKNSLYLIHLRLAAQGTLMSCITLGLIYQLGKNNFKKLFGTEKKN